MGSWNYFISGYRLIFRSGIRRYVVIPLLINTVLFAGLLWLLGHEYNQLTRWLMHFLPSWLQWLSGLLWLLFLFLVLLVMSHIFSLIANLVAAPFNGFLAEKIEAMLVNESMSTTSGWKEFLRDAPRLIVRQLHYIGYYLVRVLILVVMFFIPGVQVFVTPLWYVFGAWMMAVQYLDYPMDNHKIPFDEMRRLMRAKLGLNLGFGALVSLASMVPILNFLVIPAAVAGGTHLWVDHYLQKG